MKKGFTLVETMLGLCLLGLITVTVLPIVNSSLHRISSHNAKIEMIYLGEMVVEKIKAYDIAKCEDVYIYDTRVSEIIELFKKNTELEIILPQNQDHEEYTVKIFKKEKSEKLWELSVFIYGAKEGSKSGDVKYKAYLPSK